MKEFFKGILAYIVGYAFRFIIGIAIIVAFVFIADWLGVL